MNEPMGLFGEQPFVLASILARKFKKLGT